MTSSPEMYEITSLNPENHRQVHQAAAMLHEESVRHWPEAWPTLAAALEELEEMSRPERILLLAVDPGSEDVLGWIGGIPQYNGHTWELHPLIVREDRRGAGIGTALVRALEKEVRERGGRNLFLGSDDETGRTSLFGRGLYPNVLGALQGIRNLENHPYAFFQRIGFSIVGVIPDANGPGKPDIFMAKPIPVPE